MTNSVIHEILCKILFAWINDVIYSSRQYAMHFQAKRPPWILCISDEHSEVVDLCLRILLYLAKHCCNRHIAASLHMEIYELWFVKTLNFNLDKSHLSSCIWLLSKRREMVPLYTIKFGNICLWQCHRGRKHLQFFFIQRKRRRQATAATGS